MARLVLLTSLLVAGCAGTPEAAPPAPPDFALALSQGGGFAGRWSGVEVDARGTVTTWEGTGADRRTTTTDTLDAAELSALWDRLDPVFFDTDVDAPGNLTARMEASGDGRVHATAWEPGAHAALDSLYAGLTRLLSSNAAVQ
ncbi:hypothetical protein [Rubrivirga marina]|uniref:Uncharacterized protein n=1 Tax=Rubrivirga marina TaxID=1196024 RepID=A0A271J2Z4_9BACT|nr:hypothetical protein [Rubrivirga marina]PAP77886.1 hypothetical protein BSZ37_16280 [Rubrivirga marina]